MTSNEQNPEGSLSLEIDVPEASGRRTTDGLWFLDVREPDEFRTCHLEPDGFIPMGELEERWREIPPDKEVIAYCHHGMRSLAAAKFLRARGIPRARSLKGGIDQWSRKIDGTVPRY